MTQPLDTVRQLAYVTRDLDAAIKYWVDVLHVGPFFLIEHITLENQRYRGTPSNTDLSIALGNSGDVQIELMMQHNDEPSVYKEFLDAGRVGLHHFGIMPPDYRATYTQYKALGHEPAFELTVGEAHVVYFDTVQAIGHFTELWENSDTINQMFLTVENAAKNWDGKDPVRPANF
jgi:hypothetical protein